MVDIGARREAETEARLKQLARELEKWKDETANRLKTHATQILAAHETLESVLAHLRKSDPPLQPAVKARLILSAHRIWDFYRGKIEQRLKPEWQPFLDAADQLAYDCYEPVAKLRKKAPPLVVLTGASQPIVQARMTPFNVEGLATQEGLDARATEATRELPFPVIGLPCWQPVQLAGLVAVAHEVGHVVEDDLDCTSALQALFDSGGERAAAWKRWQRELFADAWGCLCCGQAFAHALADHLAPARPWKEPVSAASVYPPAWLRVRFAFGVAKRLGGLDGDAGLAKWEAAYPYDDALAEYLHDAEPLIEKLARFALPELGPLEKMNLRMTKEHHLAAEACAAQWAPGWKARPLPRVTRMTVGAAALRLAYESYPAHVVSLDAEPILRNTLATALTNDRRGAAGVTDAARGERLFRLLAE